MSLVLESFMNLQSTHQLERGDFLRDPPDMNLQIVRVNILEREGREYQSESHLSSCGHEQPLVVVAPSHRCHWALEYHRHHHQQYHQHHYQKPSELFNSWSVFQAYYWGVCDENF